MAYNHELAERIRAQFALLQPYTEKAMFGGIAFFVNGNMACGVSGDRLMARVGPGSYEEALARPGARPFDMTGRPMKGWVGVEAEGYASDQSLADWVGQAVAFAASLPPK